MRVSERDPTVGPDSGRCRCRAQPPDVLQRRTKRLRRDLGDAVCIPGPSRRSPGR